MIGLNLVYPVTAVMFLAFAVLGFAERRWRNGLFHLLLAISFALGDVLGDVGNGVLVVAIVLIVASGRLASRQADGGAAIAPRGAWLFAPALLIPAVAIIGTLAFKQLPAIIDPKQATLVAVVLGALLALGVCYWWLRPGLVAPFREGLRMIDDIGAVVVLPQMLASLGAVFALAKLGDVVGGLAGHIIPAGNVLGAVVGYGFGMALLTMVTGNAFAAFPVMATAIALPLLIHGHGADPARVAAIGMLAGFCGTLMTPMAANFNLVPAALLNLPNRYGVIRAQIPTALLLLAFNIALLWLVIR
ncbi:5-oxoproline transporter, DUF979 family subunit [Sphingomonas sp. GlSt437]|uniref:5-oxoproline transporter, DUF979 family subunit n=1 Tax=Sphingomonas sp. GlSt437 TaxID=3389970 RepID=UPI003A869576